MHIISLNEYKSRINNNGCSNLFNSYPWLSVLSKTYGLKFEIITKRNFFLPFSIIEDHYFKSVKLIPFGDYILNNCNKTFLAEAFDFIKEKYPGHYISTSIVNREIPVLKGFQVTKKGFLNQIDIHKWKESRDWKEAYERNIRHAINYGLYVNISYNIESVRGFYKLHEYLRINKFKKLPQPFTFFIHLYKEFIVNRSGFFLETWSKSELIASWVILIHNKTLFYKMGASNPGQLHLRPNDLLFRSLMQYGSDNGFQTVDLGFSGAAKSYEGLIRFKSKEGGERIPIYSIERYPENIDKSLLTKRINYLNSITKKAIDSGQISVIREASTNFYGKFA